jgi:CheY-like chemotaxis protein
MTRILIVDDEPTNVLLLEAFLSESGSSGTASRRTRPFHHA